MGTKNLSSTTLDNKKALTPDQEKALEAYFPQAFLPKIQKIKTVEQALKNGTSSLAKISKNVGEKRSLALIKIYLVRLNELLNLKKSLSETAIDELAQMILTDYYHLNMVDIVFVLNQAIKGKYGEFYENLGVPKVMGWFENYFEERCNEAERQSNQERSQYNSSFGSERSSDQKSYKEYLHGYNLEKYKEKNTRK